MPLPTDVGNCNSLHYKAGAKIGLRAAVYSTLVLFISDRLAEMMHPSETRSIILASSVTLLPFDLLSAIPVGRQHPRVQKGSTGTL